MIHDLLKELRENEGLSRQQVADKLKISKRTLESYEYGQREPNIEMINKFADFYGVTTDYLLGRKPKENPLDNIKLCFNDKNFAEMFVELPEYAKQIFIDTMEKLVNAAKEHEKPKSAKIIEMPEITVSQEGGTGEPLERVGTGDEIRAFREAEKNAQKDVD